MYNTTSHRWIGVLYLAPAVIFVLAFTAYPLSQMIWMSFHNWSLIEPKKWVGLANFIRAYNDRQFWISLGFTLKYTLYITPILMIGGYLIALLVAGNTPLRRFTRAVVFVPVVIGLGVSSLLWYWLFSYDFGLINRLLVDLSIVSDPVIWFGDDAEIDEQSIDQAEIVAEQPVPEEAGNAEPDDDRHEHHRAGEPAQGRVPGDKQRDQIAADHQDGRYVKRVFQGETQ